MSLFFQWSVILYVFAARSSGKLGAEKFNRLKVENISDFFVILLCYKLRHPVIILCSNNHCTYLLVFGNSSGIPNEASLLMGFLLEDTLDPLESELW